jgi:hypothetical protein
MWKCIHCPSPLSRPNGAGRGLCWACYPNRAIRDRYARYARGAINESDEPTEEELNATIAEQLENLPSWWADDCRLPPPIFVLVRCT